MLGSEDIFALKHPFLCETKQKNFFVRIPAGAYQADGAGAGEKVR